MLPNILDYGLLNLFTLNNSFTEKTTDKMVVCKYTKMNGQAEPQKQAEVDDD